MLIFGMVVVPSGSWLPGDSGGKNIPLTTVIATHFPELWKGHTSPLAYSSVLVSIADIPRKEY